MKFSNIRDKEWKKSFLELQLEAQGWELLGNEVRWNPEPLTARLNDIQDSAKYNLLDQEQKIKFETDARTKAENRLKQIYREVRFEEKAFDINENPLQS